MTIASDYPAVSAMCSKCPTFQESIKACKEIKCHWAWARAGHEQRIADDARIASEKARERKAEG
jgi:hypothetical protein